MPLGLYISIPFCRTKCTYCNFASDVFSGAVFKKYVDRVCAEIGTAPETADQMGASFERTVDSVYFGGGTPTLLNVTELERIFVTIRQNFDLLPSAEVTMECAPGTLSPEMITGLRRCGVNRISLGVQSFVDQEARSVGRLHTCEIVLDDIARLRASGLPNINVDLIAGLPHQTRESWDESLNRLIATGVPHASVYMLEVDEESRLGREVIAGGQKYHAHFVPDEDLTADFYEIACDQLNAAGIQQYEISNFARTGFESKHNLKYWTRKPYLGFGVDAHSMLQSENRAVRFSNPDVLEMYVAGEARESTIVSQELALQEEFFLGLRLNHGVNMAELAERYSTLLIALFKDGILELIGDKLLEQNGDVIALTRLGRLLSNEVFQRFISVPSEL
jgi:putative oxygen-independent coproporphyrinogen III oxidase